MLSLTAARHVDLLFQGFGMWAEDDVQSLDFLQQSGMSDRDATASTAATMPTLSSLMTHIIL
ncbi:hypothetical protein U0070_000820 [Myodes glareolus]|uniref:Uncharacterized protein n=1 Tax=Myodes glareolus TaxID=447135 RepID=A0AAW0HI59_MYOGA